MQFNIQATANLLWATVGQIYQDNKAQRAVPNYIMFPRLLQRQCLQNWRHGDHGH